MDWTAFARLAGENAATRALRDITDIYGMKLAVPQSGSFCPPDRPDQPVSRGRKGIPSFFTDIGDFLEKWNPSLQYETMKESKLDGYRDFIAKKLQADTSISQLRRDLAKECPATIRKNFSDN